MPGGPTPCPWCGWPDPRAPGAPDLEPVTLDVADLGPRVFCFYGCGIAFGQAYGHPEVVHQARARAGLPWSVQLPATPAHYLCEWAAGPGGFTRAHWIAASLPPPRGPLPRDSDSPSPRAGRIRGLRVPAPK